MESGHYIWLYGVKWHSLYDFTILFGYVHEIWQEGKVWTFGHGGQYCSQDTDPVENGQENDQEIR